MKTFRPYLSVLLIASAFGCAAEPIVHNLEEREANQILELLADNEIVATKQIVDTGRTVSYTVSTQAGKTAMSAIRVLNQYEMPRRHDNGYLDVFKESGLIPTAAEERAKGLAAIEGEIEKQLKLVDGILDAQVNLVIPEENALRTAQDVRSPTTAAVTLKYLGSSSKPLSEPQVQAVVAAGVERLTPDNVVVVMTPSMGFSKRSKAAEAAVATPVAGTVPNTWRMGLLGGAIALALLLLMLVVQQARLSTVRGRLERLQSEIAKARRKPGDGPTG